MSTTTRGLRRLWFRVHQWIGIGLLVGLIPLGLTGSLLVWRGQIDRMDHPGRYGPAEARATLSPSRYLDAARAALPQGARPTAVRMPRQPGDPVTVMARPARAEGQAPPPEGRRPPMLSVWLDPTTARVLEVGAPQNPKVAWLHQFHENFFSRDIGGKVVGWLGWAMLASSLTGLWLWWPRGNPLKGLRYRRTGDSLLNIHHLAGFWISLPLAVLSLTGVYLAFPQTGRAVVSAFAPMSPPQVRGDGPALTGGGQGEGGRREGGGRGGRERSGGAGGEGRRGPALSVDEAVDRALAAAPGARLTAVNLPGGRAPVWKVQVRSDGQPLELSVPDAGGPVVRPPAPLPGDGVNQWMHRLHGGQQTGPVWQWIIFLGGLAPLLLGVTGLVVWIRRRLRRASLA